MSNVDKRLGKLEAQRITPAKAFEAELKHQLSLMTSAQLEHDVAGLIDIARRLAPDDPAIAAWIADYDQLQGA